MPLVLEYAEPGSDETLRAVERKLPEQVPDGCIHIIQSAVGVNYIDAQQCRDPAARAPNQRVPGVEGVGVIARLGNGVTHLEIGDRVAYFEPSGGAYASERIIRAARAVKIEASIVDSVGAIFLVRGLASYLFAREVAQIKPGMTVAVQSAAGGLGSFLALTCMRLGARVIGIIGSEKKSRAAKDAGSFWTLVRKSDWPEKARAITDEIGVHVMFDGLGGEGVLDALRCVREGGKFLSYGSVTGPLHKEFQARAKAQRVEILRPSVFTEFVDDAKFQEGVKKVFALMSNNVLPAAGQTFKLAEAAQALAALEAGQTTGSLLLRTDTPFVPEHQKA